MKAKLIALIPALLAATACADAGTPPELDFPMMAPTAASTSPVSWTVIEAAAGADSTELAKVAPVAPKLRMASTAAPVTILTAAAPAALTALVTEQASPSPIVLAEAPATPSKTDAKDTTIDIKDFAFAPGTTTITAGTTIHWKNLDGEPHTVRSIDSKFGSNALDQNDSFDVKIDKPGTYRYICSIHPQMTGTIVVKPAN